MAEARRKVESRKLEGAASSAAFEQYLDDATYDGLNHVGGVCFVDDPRLRPTDEIVPKQVYDAERLAIETANRQRCQNVAQAREESNDLWRRPFPGHETLSWRTRVAIVSHAELLHHVPYKVADLGYAYLRLRDAPLQTGEIFSIVDIYHGGDGTVEDALLLGRESAELLADMLAIAAYGPATVTQVFATTPPVCRDGIEFELAAFASLHSNSAVPVEPSVFENFSSTAPRMALRNARRGLSMHLPADAFTSFWNAAENLSQERAREQSWKRTTKCQSCGSLRDIGWDLKRGFRQMYVAANVDPDLFDKHRSIRGRVQHGSSSSDIADQREIHSEIGGLRATAVVATATTLGVVPQTTTYLSQDQWPIAVWSCTPHGDSMTHSMKRFSTQFAVSGLPQSACGDQGRSVFCGMSPDTKPDAVCFPPLAR